jgi:hypothetical protein
MVEPVGVAGDVVLRSARAAQDAAIASHKSERPRGGDTLATQPLETAVRGDEGSSSERSRARARSRTWAFVAVTALLAVGAGAAWRVKANGGRSDGVPTATTTTMGSPTTTTATAVVSSLVATPAPSARPGASAALLAPSGVSTSVPPTPAVHRAPATSVSAPATAGRAFVSFLGDPGTRVSIDGASRGSCPVRVNLEPGQHDVRFQFDPTGESRGERFSVKANERVTVRAEFTGATPTVRIQR